MSTSLLNSYNIDKIKKYSIVSKKKYNREYLLSTNTAKELNTYLSFDPFPTFNDIHKVEFDENNNEVYSGNGPGTPGVRSIFNKAGSVIIGSQSGDLNIDITNGDESNTSEWRISNNVPLMDSPAARMRIRKNSGCSIKELVNASECGLLGRNTYSYSDFMYCKHLGKMSNNYLITLRRFPLPVDDYISSLGESSRADKDVISKNVQSIGCMVTWLGTAGNEMANILNYSYSMPFTLKKAELTDAGTDADANASILNGIAAAFDETYRKEYRSGQASAAYNEVIGKFFGAGEAPYPASQYKYFKDNNKVYGPVDVIKDVYMRSEEGLQFNQSFSITFDYELRSYNGINGRQAMLDLLSNILNVTYSTGTFWGGGYRGGGAHQNNIFTNLEVFKANGGFTDFADAFTKDYTNVTSAIGNRLKGKKPLELIKGFFNELGGMIVGGALNKFGRPHKQMINSILSPAPVGFWHVTIGNPHHPIMSIGNMILKNTKIEHYGPLGLDDFPTGIKVTCDLERGKTRDLRDIEKLYMHGNDRIEYSMGPKVFDMYKYAKEYKGSSKTTAYKGPDDELMTDPSKWSMDITNDNYKNTLKKYFGHTDTYSIYVAAAEQESGAHKKKPSAQGGTSAGDSSASGNVATSNSFNI